MGKKIYVLLCLLITSVAAGQGVYEVSVKGSILENNNAYCSEFRIKAILDDGNEVIIYNQGYPEDRRVWIDEKVQIPNNRTVRKINVYAKRHHKRNCRTPSKHQWGHDFVLSYPYTCFYTDSNQYGKNLMSRRGDPDDPLSEMDLTFMVVPKVEIDPPGINDFLPADHRIDITATRGFPQTRSAYNWEYSLDGGRNFMSLPTAFNGRQRIQVSARDILGSQVTNYYGRNILFRISSCSSRRESVYSRAYKIVPSAPTFVAKQEFIPSCNGGSDGSVRFTFSRPLIAGETLTILPADGSLSFPSSPQLSELETNPVTGVKDTYLLENVSSGVYRATVIGKYGSFNTYTDDAAHYRSFTINSPTPVVIEDIAKIDNWCNDGDTDPNTNNDGAVIVTASGGNPGIYQISYRRDGGAYSSWQDFNNGNVHRIVEATPGIYDVRVQKLVRNRSVACLAYELNMFNQPTSTIQVESIEVTEPPAPIQLEYITEESFDPTANGFTNGQIKVRVFGGTPFDDNTYSYIWKDVNGNTLTTVDTAVETDGSGNPQFLITLRDVGEGIYFINVTDKNYSSATYTTGCFTGNGSYILEDPEPLTLQIEETNPISCNPVDTDFDKDKDGELTANAAGGVPLQPGDNGGLLYYYTWKKKNASGVWEVIKDKNEGEPVLGNLSEGEYAVNIEDGNGIIIGTYVNNVLDEATDVTYDLQAPAPITIILDKQDVYCYGGNDGFIHLTVTGGTGAYDVQWLDDGSITSLNRDNLIEGFYTVIIEDEKGCSTRETIEITQPTTPLRLTYPSLYSQPTAFGLTDGWIEARVSGGTANADGSYNFIWADQDGMDWQSNVITSIDPDTNEFILRLQNIGKGYYTLTITDANHILASVKDGCTITNGFQLEEPEPLRVVIEEDTPISCNQLNEYGDPFSDGVLIAHATGGIRFNPGLPYVYTWKKQNASGNWDVLTTQTDSIARNLSDGTYAVNIEDANGIILGEYVNNILVRPTDSTHVFREPRLLQVTLTKQDVYCYDGRDGWIEATIEGGTPPYTLLWNTGETTERIEELVQGDYDILVTDSRGCNAMATITLEQPIAPIEVTYTAFSRPSGIGNPDAWIEATIKGGTSFDDFSYTYNWVDVSGTSLNSQTQTEITPDNAFRIRLNGITAGRYYLTIQNKNYEIATTKEGCTFIDSEFTIYEPIEATIEEFTPISCNQSNEEFDPFSDGAIVGHVRGGVPFSNGLPYRYTWKKQNVAGEWEVLSNQNDSIATNLSAGWYALNAEDSMGQVMGIYESEILIRAIDSTFYFEEPLLLEVALSATPISCDTGNNGTASVAITGGTPPYTIEWSTGSMATTTTGLISGTYIVYVTDSRGCRAEGSIYIDQPGGLNIQIEEAKNPTCFEGEDGSIAVQITGGTPPYTYEWNTGKNVLALNNLREGSYLLSIEDANGCRAFQEITLTDPLPIPLELGENRTICADQALTLDIGIEDSGATYVWSSDAGFSSTEPLISLTEPGIYRATITTSLGCTTSDEVQVIVSEDEIDADFLLATQAYTDQEVILVNVSSPIGERVVWTVPEDVTVLGEETEKLILQFDAPGVYPIHLRSYQGDCYQDYEKNIIVEKNIETAVPQDDQQRFIKELLVYPNPTQGEFTIKIALAEVSNVNVRVINLITSDVMNEREAQGHSDYLLDFTAAYLPSGVYLLSVETPNGNAIRKLVVE